MKRCVLFTLTLTLISTLAVAQAVVTPYGTATQQGAAVPVAPVSPPLVTTPIMHLGNAPTTPGTSTAAVSLPGSTPEPPSAVPIRPEISLGPETIYVGPAGANPANAANEANTTVIVNGRQVFDRGVNSNAAMTLDDGTHGRPLGDIARDNRQRMQNANAKTFTNADVERMAGAGGITGIATNSANNGYPSDNGVININAAPGAVAAPSNPVAPPTTEQSTPPSNQKPSAATPPPQEMAQAQTLANPADQNAQAGTAQNTEQRTLPKAASPLPLIALIGLTATLSGFFIRKYRS